MIRMIQRRLIIPRGDTGSFTIPIIAATSGSDVAIFAIFDCLTHSKVFDKEIQINDGDELLEIEFTHEETVNLPPGKYVWDIKFYKNPRYEDEELVDGDEVHSYYASYDLPICEIRETADTLLLSNEAPAGKLKPTELNYINTALATINNAIKSARDFLTHSPTIINENWHIWDAVNEEYIDTGINAHGSPGPQGPQGPQGLQGLQGEPGEVTQEEFDEFKNTVNSTKIINKVGPSNVINIADSANSPAKNLTITIQPQQDLHGYDFPWPAGGGKNLLPDEFPSNVIIAAFDPINNIIKADENSHIFAIPCEQNADYTLSNNVTSDWEVAFGDNIPAIGESIEYKGSMENRDSFTINSGTHTYLLVSFSSIESFENHITNECMIEKESFATSYAPYSNICPITGWMEANVTRRGKNLWNNNVTYGDATIFNLEVGKTYTVSAKRINDASYAFLCLNKKNTNNSKTRIGNIIFSGNESTVTFTVENGYLYTLESDTSYSNITNVQVELGSVATAYEPYNIISDSIQLWLDAGMVYGGMLNVTTGLLAVDLCKITIPSYYWDWTIENETVIWTAPINNNLLFESHIYQYVLPNFVGYCDKYKIASYEEVVEQNTHYSLAIKNNTIFVNTDGTDMFEPGEINIILKPISPLVYQVDPVTIQLLLGPNTIWSDAGDSTLEYVADNKIYVDNRIKDLAIDVQVNNKSIINNNIANIPIGNNNTYGVVRIASEGEIKLGLTNDKILAAQEGDKAVFYGLAKVAGDDTQSTTSNPVGQYTESAQSAINQMLNKSFTNPYTNAVISAKSGIRYICGKVTSLEVRLPASGIVDVMFESGAVATVLTIIPPTGIGEVKWANNFDPTNLNTNTIYEINIADGEFGVAAQWT